MQITERKCLTNPRANVNGPCAVFPHPLKRSGFSPSMDWYITERDMEEDQLQAFGMINNEIGYISIEGLINNGVELDYHWTPVTLKVLKSNLTKELSKHE